MNLTLHTYWHATTHAALCSLVTSDDTWLDGRMIARDRQFQLMYHGRATRGCTDGGATLSTA